MRRAAFLLAVCLSTASAAADADVRSLMDAGHWKQARALLEPRVKANPSDAEAAALLSRVRSAFGDSDGALTLAETAVKLKPQVADYHWQLAQVCGDQARRAGVFRQFGLARRFRQEAETTIALDPKHVDARIGLIVFYIQAPGIVGGDRKKADLMADEVARIDAASGFLARARVVTESKGQGDLEALYRQAAGAAKTPDVKYQAAISLANLYLNQKKYEAAEQQAHALMTIDAHRASPHSVLAIVYATAGKWTELDQALAEAEKAVHDNLVPYFQAGRVILTQGQDYPRAERYLRKYLSQEPEAGPAMHALAHWRLGLVLEKEGKRGDAIAELEHATRLNPNLDDAKKDLKRLRSS